MQKGQYIGIDFGTTNTAVVCVQDDALGRKTTRLGEGGGYYPFSSIAALPKEKGKPILFGREVRERRLELAETHEVHTSMKLFLGKKDSNGDPVNFVVDGQRYSPQEITEAFFSHIKKYVREQYDIDIEAASLSFPVDFSSEARRELCEAAKRTGIELKAFVSESTAAYIANRSECRATSNVVVLDWGGGTLDISILKLTGTKVREVAVWGEPVGGDDIDRELAERIHARIAKESRIEGGRFTDMQPAEQDQMIMKCEEAKISISNDDEDGEDYPLSVNNYGAYGTKTTTISEEDFNALIEPIIKERVLKAINEALARAGGIALASIDTVIVVGGSSDLRLFEYAITNLFKNAKIVQPDDKQWSSATGAALMQIVDSELKLSDAVGLRLSDDSVFAILPSDYVVGEEIDPLTFSLVEDAQGAHFIFTDSTGKKVYTTKNVPTKGFLKEKLELTARIGYDQIARIDITNNNFGDRYKKSTVEINKLTFHYELHALDDADQAGQIARD